ncbi:unnamed protein product, partial [Polarella glacialis]
VDQGRRRWFQRRVGIAGILLVAVLLAVSCGVAVLAILSHDGTSHNHPHLPSDSVEALPGWAGPLPSRMFSGYLNVTHRKHYHYIFVEQEGGPAEQAPVMLWLNGGPGCSSLDGFIYEHGPFRLDPKDPAKLVRFDFTWAKLANVIYLEGPVGVGFSYSDDETDYSKCNDDTTAEDNLAAVNLFFERYPNFRNNDFFIAGESYAGVYVPTLAEALLRAQDAGNYTGAPLRGISVGNGCIGSEVGVCSGGANRDRFEIPYLLGTAFLPEALKKRVRDGCDFEITGPSL